MSNEITPIPLDRNSNEMEIRETSNQVSDCIKQQQREIESLDELDELLIRLTATNKKRKDKVTDVKRRMRYLDSQM